MIHARPHNFPRNRSAHFIKSHIHRHQPWPAPGSSRHFCWNLPGRKIECVKHDYPRLHFSSPKNEPENSYTSQSGSAGRVTARSWLEEGGEARRLSVFDRRSCCGTFPNVGLEFVDRTNCCVLKSSPHRSLICVDVFCLNLTKIIQGNEKGKLLELSWIYSSIVTAHDDVGCDETKLIPYSSNMSRIDYFFSTVSKYILNEPVKQNISISRWNINSVPSRPHFPGQCSCVNFSYA